MVFLPPVSSKWVPAFGCGAEVALVQWKKKKGDCFPVRGAFWENRGSAYRSQPSKGFEGALTSPLLKFFHPSKRATSSCIRERFTCLSPTTAVQPRGCKSRARGCTRVHGKCSIKEPSVHPHTLQTVHSGGTLTSRHILHVFIISFTPPHGLRPAMKSGGICGSARCCRVLPFLREHPDGAQRRNSFLVFI